ncbi:MAG: DUF4097 family beta strand repeat-containing protein [Sediminibacterium sp.]
MKTIKIITAFVVTLVLSGQTMAQQAAEQKEQLVVPLSQPGKPFKLTVSLLAGSIKVVGYEGKDVVIDVSGEDKRKKGGGSDKSGGMKRITAGNGLDVSAEENDNNVRVHTSSLNSPVNLVIKVPMSEAKMKLRGTNDGDIIVSNVNGEIEASHTNGHVTLTDISGSAVASSTNGNIKVTFKTIDPKAAMAFTSFNGAVDVTFPATLKANIKAKSDQGDIYSDFDIDADKTQPTVNKTVKNGTYRINIESWVYGKINLGGPELMMKTYNGNIYIRKAK